MMCLRQLLTLFDTQEKDLAEATMQTKAVKKDLAEATMQIKNYDKKVVLRMHCERLMLSKLSSCALSVLELKYPLSACWWPTLRCCTL